MIARQSKRPQSARPPKARYRGGGAHTDELALTDFGPADAIALARKAAKEH